MHKKIQDSLSKREEGNLVSTIDGSILPQDCVEDLLCETQRNW